MSDKLMMVVLGVLVLLMIFMGVGLFAIWSKVSTIDQIVKPPSVEEPNKEAEKPLEENREEKTIGPMFPLDTFIVNLADRGGKRYLRVTMNLELESEDVKAEVEKHLPQLRDSILMILPERTVNDIQTAEGKADLRDEIMAKLNNTLEKGKIINIFFTEFVIQ